MTKILDGGPHRDHDSGVREEWLNREFGRRVRDKRTNERMSQGSLAKAASLSRTSIVNVENGKQGVSLGTLYRLADALSCQVSEILPPPPSEELPRITGGDDSPEAKQAVMRVLQRAQSDT